MTDASKHPVRNSLLLGAAAISATFALAGATGTLARKILPEDPPEPPETIEPEVVTIERDGGVVAQDPIAIEPARDASAEGALADADAGVAAARVSPPRTTVRRTTPRTTRVRTRSS